MRCDEFSARFDELLDQRREPMDEPQMAAHAAGCVDCRRTAVRIGAAIGALADLRVPACGLTPDRVLAAIRRDQAESGAAISTPEVAPAADSIARRSVAPAFVSTTASRSPSAGLWRGSAFYALMATAATVVFAAYPVWQWNASPAAVDPNGAQIAATDPSGTTSPNGATGLQPPGTGIDKPEVAVDPETLPSFTELARESRDSYEQLARDTRRSLGDALAVADVFSSATPAYDGGSDETDGWLNQVESGLEPLKRSTLGTLDVLRQVVPADTESRS